MHWDADLTNSCFALRRPHSIVRTLGESADSLMDDDTDVEGCSGLYLVLHTGGVGVWFWWGRCHWVYRICSKFWSPSLFNLGLDWSPKAVPSLLPPNQCLRFHRTPWRQRSENGFPLWCHMIGCVRRDLEFHHHHELYYSPLSFSSPSFSIFICFILVLLFSLFLFGGVSCWNGCVSERYLPQETIIMEKLKQTETIQISIRFMYRFLAWEKV